MTVLLLEFLLSCFWHQCLLWLAPFKSDFSGQKAVFFFLFSLNIRRSSTFCDFAVHMGCFEICTVNFHVLLKWCEEEEECPWTPFGVEAKWTVIFFIWSWMAKMYFSVQLIRFCFIDSYGILSVVLSDSKTSKQKKKKKEKWIVTGHLKW